MMHAGIQRLLKREWRGVEDPCFGGLDRVIEGVVVARFKDGTFGVLSLDENDGDPYQSPKDGGADYREALALAAEMLLAWKHTYRQDSVLMEDFIEGRR